MATENLVFDFEFLIGERRQKYERVGDLLKLPALYDIGHFLYGGVVIYHGLTTRL